MKVGILISDLTVDQARSMLNDLGGLPAPGGKLAAGSISIVNDSSDDDEGGVAATGEFDSTGLRWDARIHAKSRAQNKDGRWKQRKGVQPIEVTTVEAELRAAAQSAPAPQQQYQAPAAPAAPAVPQQQYQAPAAPAAPMAPPAPAAPIAPAAPAAPVAVARDFNGLMTHISNLFKAERITPDYPQTIVDRINQQAAYFGTTITTPTDVANDPRMVDYAWQCLDADGKGV